MNYEVISADCHIDLPWLPEDLFTSRCLPRLRKQMPCVQERVQGRIWVTADGAFFGIQNGMRSAGRKYAPGEIHRSDRMDEQGLYKDGANGVRRITIPELRLQDQDLDGVQAEVLYGVLGAAMRLKNGEVIAEVLRIYNDWVAEFCATYPDRFAGIASVASHAIEAAITEVHRVTARGVLRGVEISCTHDMKPLFDPVWEPLWVEVENAGLPLLFHTIGPQISYNYSSFGRLQQRHAFAVHITSFQLSMAKVIMEIIYGGVLESHPKLKIVIGESGIDWVPYILDHMDLEWQDQFRDLTLTMKPSEYWRRQCFATYQSDPIGLRLLDIIGEENVMWGSDFPHPDGVWPDSQEFIEREFQNISDESKSKIICGNAARLYGFEQYI